jgi:hypothetical protein
MSLYIFTAYTKSPNYFLHIFSSNVSMPCKVSIAYVVWFERRNKISYYGLIEIRVRASIEHDAGMKNTNSYTRA